MNTHSSISSQGSLTRDKNSSIPDQPSPILLYDGGERKKSFSKLKVVTSDASVRLFNEGSQASIVAQPEPIGGQE